MSTVPRPERSSASTPSTDQATTKERVRAVLVTPTGSLLLMRRVRPGTAPYWVVVGGGVEPTDASHQDTLRREVREEVGGDAEILHLLHTLDSDGERQHFYVATIASWDFAARTGPEFTRPDRSEYALDEIAPTAQARDEINLLPTAFAAVLREALVRGDLPGPPDQPASTDGTPPDPPHRATP